MKFVVMVNQKYLVTVEANSNGGAEHRILDNVYYGVKTAQAFSADEMATDFFKSCLEECETISISELMDKALAYKKFEEKYFAEVASVEEYQKQIEELKAAIKLAEENRKAHSLNANILSRELKDI